MSIQICRRHLQLRRNEDIKKEECSICLSEGKSIKKQVLLKRQIHVELISLRCEMKMKNHELWSEFMQRIVRENKLFYRAKDYASFLRAKAQSSRLR